MAQSVEAGRSVIWPGRHVTTKLCCSRRSTDPMIVALRNVQYDVWSGKRPPASDVAPVAVAAGAGR